MPKVKNVEKKIWDVEGFDVTIKHQDGRDLRGDFTGLPQYDNYERQAKNDMTVAEWREKRFYPKYPGYEVDVLDGDGKVTAGNTKLANVRDSYLEE